MVVTRVQRFARFCDLTGASSNDLLGEYVNVLTARDHEFQNAHTRNRYAELVLAMLTYVYGEDRREEALTEVYRVQKEQENSNAA